MFVCAERKNIFKTDGITEEERDGSDSIFIRGESTGLLAV